MLTVFGGTAVTRGYVAADHISFFRHQTIVFYTIGLFLQSSLVSEGLVERAVSVARNSTVLQGAPLTSLLRFLAAVAPRAGAAGCALYTQCSTTMLFSRKPGHVF
jgi:hypothetical protein